MSVYVTIPTNHISGASYASMQGSNLLVMHTFVIITHKVVNNAFMRHYAFIPEKLICIIFKSIYLSNLAMDRLLKKADIKTHESLCLHLC